MSSMLFIDQPGDEDRSAAREILVDRLASTPLTADNKKIVCKLLGFMKGELHCYTTRRNLPEKDRKTYRCTVCKHAGLGVVAAACFRHVDSPRRATSGQVSFTELLLLAVHRAHERKGFGRAMVEHVVRLSAAAESKKLVVC